MAGKVFDNLIAVSEERRPLASGRLAFGFCVAGINRVVKSATLVYTNKAGNPENSPGVESCKSIFFGVDGGGVGTG
jgi:hypothetical protein